MARKLISLISILAVLNLTTGCTVHTTETVILGDYMQIPDMPIAEVVTAAGETLYFNDNGGVYDANYGVVTGLDIWGKPITVKVEDILYVRVNKVEPVGSTILTTLAVLIGVLALLFIVIAASSCPLVYTFDGEQFVFDAEPLGGSISKGLEKTDWSRLEHLKAREGSYEMIVRNQMPETQHLDEMRLLVADHPAGTTVWPDIRGGMHAVRNAIAPSSARDEADRDLLPFVARQDFTAWQSQLPRDTSFRGGDTRHHLTFTFPRPEGATSASLLVNAGTATWGSNMIREMLKLRGDKLDTWYADVDAGGLEKLKLGAFVLREELFILKVQVKEGNGWVHRGYIPGSGPFMTEGRLCALDLSHVTGDVVEIRLDPPVGYWIIDHVALSYTAPEDVAVQLVSPAEAVDQDGKDVASLLAEADGRYHDMPITGQYFTARYPVPPVCQDMDRSVFLQTTGWYELHLEKDQPEQTALIQELMNTPGRIVTYSLERFLTWRFRDATAKN